MYSVNAADHANIQSYLQEMFSTGWEEYPRSSRFGLNASTDPVPPPRMLGETV